ncbi:glycosyltransferase family 2 protein [Elizabethkingia meningoseptica]|uniref:glycosyltransferase family 2 protein n=1 Tax=Elizabethkingia meningoseptica TaxID=238 RepID=UPI002012C2A2|nr:glycosyltransferase family 2 protein [Elizabethkingia meningoseptica]MCL1675698.1 glycosyltransferase [Elizabethkingia meningoseptica]MCL1686886.1 glycosyltransferase [Elizabethkingia meningoseptica]
MIPLISIIVPVYKVEQFIHECVDSIIDQTYNHLEIILVNDGSPDRCGEICEEYAKQDHRIVVIHKENGGLSSARNAGLDICKGEYIAFIDSDDVIHPQFVELLYANIKEADLAFCEMLGFDSHLGITKEEKIEDVLTKRFGNRELLSQILSFKAPNVVVVCNKLYHRRLWEIIKFPAGKIHEDEFVIHETLDQCKEIVFIDAKLYYYRKREESIMSSAGNDKGVLDKLEAYTLRRKYFLQKGMLKEVKEMNTAILERCVLQTVTKDNPSWKEMNIKIILLQNSLSIYMRIILLIKKIDYRLYRVLQNSKKYIKKQNVIIKKSHEKGTTFLNV